jgi:hypothetical protein
MLGIPAGGATFPYTWPLATATACIGPARPEVLGSDAVGFGRADGPKRIVAAHARWPLEVWDEREDTRGAGVLGRLQKRLRPGP